MSASGFPSDHSMSKSAIYKHPLSLNKNWRRPQRVIFQSTLSLTWLISQLIISPWACTMGFIRGHRRLTSPSSLLSRLKRHYILLKRPVKLFGERRTEMTSRDFPFLFQPPSPVSPLRVQERFKAWSRSGGVTEKERWRICDCGKCRESCEQDWCRDLFGMFSNNRRCLRCCKTL